jgi:ATP-dependent Clp protease ATP-binding subunit ClpA
MFERFTDRARRVVVLAQEEARGLQHSYIGTEHLLLGLIAQGDGVGGQALAQLGVTLDDVRADVERIIGRGSGEVAEGHIPFTPRSKAALERSLREALALSHNYIGTEHVLLGVASLEEGVAAQILLQRCGDLGVVRNTVVSILSGMTPGPGPAPTPMTTSSWSPALRATMELVEGRASAGSIGTHHVLSVLAELGDETAAGRALAAGGFDPSKLPTPIAEWDVAGTKDETEEAWALRVTDITIDEGGRLGINLNDPELRERITAALSSDDPEVRAAFGRAIRELQQKLPPPSSD